MSLLDDAIADHAAAVARLVDELEKGSLQERAALLNLREETRVPEHVRRAFHAALAASTATSVLARLCDGCSAGPLVLPVPEPRRMEVARLVWWTCITRLQLQNAGTATPLDPLEAAPPPTVRLRKPYQKTRNGVEIPFWISPCASTDADEVRDRLGLAHIPEGTEIYRIAVRVNSVTRRDLYIPTALDSYGGPAWRRPQTEPLGPWGMTCHLQTDDPAEPELLTFSHENDESRAAYVGKTTKPPSEAYLHRRLV